MTAIEFLQEKEILNEGDSECLINRGDKVWEIVSIMEEYASAQVNLFTDLIVESLSDETQ